LEIPGSPLQTTLHAEQFSTLVAAGVGRKKWKETGLLSLAQDGTGAPCGHCRQWLAEFEDAPNLRLIGTGKKGLTTRMETIFPDAFGPAALNNSCPLLANDPSCAHQQRKSLRSANTSTFAMNDKVDELVQAAINAATNSYTPYSSRRSGVSLRTTSGEIYAAGAYESVAFNPTVQPVMSALVALIVGGGSIPGPQWASHISDAVLAEDMPATTQLGGAGPSYAAHTAGVLRSLAPNATLRVVAVDP
jgi:cytidine deaminase